MQRADASFLSQSVLSLVLLFPSTFHFPPQRLPNGLVSLTTAMSVYIFLDFGKWMWQSVCVCLMETNYTVYLNVIF